MKFSGMAGVSNTGLGRRVGYLVWRFINLGGWDEVFGQVIRMLHELVMGVSYRPWGFGQRFSDIGGVFSHNGLERKGVLLARKVILGLFEKGFLTVTLQACLDKNTRKMFCLVSEGRMGGVCVLSSV